MLQLKKANDRLGGDNTEAKRKRNALVNALIALMPEIDSGETTLQAVVRTAMYAMAPVYLWQFFSSQGKSGTTRSSFVTELPNIYKALMTAVASKSKMNKNSIVSTIASVVRSCQTRAESRKYRQQHPELFAASADAESSKRKESSVERRQLSASSDDSLLSSHEATPSNFIVGQSKFGRAHGFSFRESSDSEGNFNFVDDSD